jgi:hypothetical protein
VWPDVPPLLYHYTTSPGLHGILSSKTIWATDTRFTNDAREHTYGLEQLLPELTKQILAREPALNDDALQVMLGDVEPARYFVACFCEQGDLLSQWRGYASPGGYALGFDTEALFEPAQGPPVYPVIYGRPDTDIDSAARQWASLAADGFVEIFQDVFAGLIEGRPQGEDAEGDIAHRVYDFHRVYLARSKHLCALMKDRSFGEEKEWRIVEHWSPVLSTSPRVDFRHGALGLTPYVSISLPDQNGRLPLREVIVGPGPHTDLRRSAVEFLLEELGYSDVDVHPSAIAYRT